MVCIGLPSFGRFQTLSFFDGRTTTTNKDRDNHDSLPAPGEKLETYAGQWEGSSHSHWGKMHKTTSEVNHVVLSLGSNDCSS